MTVKGAFLSCGWWRDSWPDERPGCSRVKKKFAVSVSKEPPLQVHGAAFITHTLQTLSAKLFWILEIHLAALKQRHEHFITSQAKRVKSTQIGIEIWYWLSHFAGCFLTAANCLFFLSINSQQQCLKIAKAQGFCSRQISASSPLVCWCPTCKSVRDGGGGGGHFKTPSLSRTILPDFSLLTWWMRWMATVDSVR